MYPEDIEEWWGRQALNHFHLRDLKVAAQKLADRAGKLSDAFTTERSAKFSGCYETPLDWITYGNFFFPQTYARTQLALSELTQFRGWKPAGNRPLKILDVGGGSGAALIAAVDTLAAQSENLNFEATLLDQSELALKYYRALSRDRRKRSLFKTTIQQASLAEPEKWQNTASKFDLILVSFSLGEAFHEKPGTEVLAWLDRMEDLLELGGILLILEPALKETSERLERLRNHAAATPSWHIWGPCLHRHHCPLLEGKKFWCHEVRHWQVPPMVNRINTSLKRSVWDLKFSFLALGNTELSHHYSGSEYLRLLSPVAKGHGRLLLSGCNAAGVHAEYDILKRHLSKEQTAKIETLERGDIISLGTLETLGGSGQFRIMNPDQIQRVLLNS